MKIETGITLTIDFLANGIKNNTINVHEFYDDIYQKIEKYSAYNIWISILPKKEVFEKLASLDKDLPLYGIPFAVKDNIDVHGFPTTAACKEFEYQPKTSSVVVKQLEDLGAICIGKTNMDQFATGLVGTRSPYGIVKNAYNSDYISGGSSSGSALAVALGIVCFSLGTDTAGSGRIPAAFNNILGYKPSLGLLSNNGCIPACKSLDSISIFAINTSDIERIMQILGNFNPHKKDEKKPIVGVPKEEQLEFFGNSEYRNIYFQKIEALRSAGYSIQEFDFSPFREVALLLYEGPWVAERLSSNYDFFENNYDKLLDVIQTILKKGKAFTAVDFFLYRDKLDLLKQKCDSIIDEIDTIILPTAPTIYTIEEVVNNPIELNSNLGYYTNFVNLLGLCAYAIPAGFTQNHLPFGLTIMAKGGKDQELISNTHNHLYATINTI